VNSLPQKANWLPGGSTSFMAVSLLGLSGLIHLGWLADIVAGFPLGRWVGRSLHRPGSSLNKPLALGLVAFEWADRWVWLATVVVFLSWLYTAAANLPRLGVRSPRFSPGWAVGWFFVPVVNLVRPYQVLRDVWANSEPPRRESGDPNPRGVRGPLVIKLWWACCLLSLLPWLVPVPSDLFISLSMSIGSDLGGFRWTPFLVIPLWRHGVTALAALFGMLMVWLIRRRQVKAASVVELRGFET
jgi:hypothetical protein